MAVQHSLTQGVDLPLAGAPQPHFESIRVHHGAFRGVMAERGTDSSHATTPVAFGTFVKISLVNAIGVPR